MMRKGSLLTIIPFVNDYSSCFITWFNSSSASTQRIWPLVNYQYYYTLSMKICLINWINDAFLVLTISVNCITWNNWFIYLTLSVCKQCLLHYVCNGFNIVVEDSFHNFSELLQFHQILFWFTKRIVIPILIYILINLFVNRRLKF